MDSVEISLVSPWGVFSKDVFHNGPYGFFDPASEVGEINIPAISLAALRDLFSCRPYVSLSDVLRHEYAHAFEHHHPKLVHSVRFERAFGFPHDAGIQVEFDPEYHVSPYAASCVGQEDYAETFMSFVKYGGRLPMQFDTAVIRQKWRYIAHLCDHCKRRS